MERASYLGRAHEGDAMTDNLSTRDSPASAQDGCNPRRFALLLVILIFVAFPKVVLGLQTFAVRDYGIFSYPVAHFHRLSFWRGELPFWNPYDCLGLPFLAQLNTLALYPLSLVYLLLPMPWSLSFFCLFHLFLGGMGMYFLAARWTGSRAGAALAGLVFTFNGLSLTFLMWPSHVATFAWLPWVIMLTEAGWNEGGRKVVWAALAAAMEALAGGPETILFTWLILTLMALIQLRRRGIRPRLLAARFLLMGGLAFGLAAPQLLTFADFAVHSSRDTHFATSAWAMPPWGWASFLVPLFQTERWQSIAMQPHQYWTSSYYNGIGVMLLVLIAVWRVRNWRVWLLGGVLLASMVLAMGDKAYIYMWLRHVLPFLGLFRYPIKFVILSAAVIPLLAAFALGSYEKTQNRRPGFGKLEICLAASFALLIGVILWFARYRPVPFSSWTPTLRNGLERLGMLGVVLGLLYFFACKPQRRSWSVFLLLAVCWLDLVTSVPWQNPTVAPSIYQADLGQMKAKLTPAPDIAESRLMMSPYAANQFYYKPAADLTANCLLDRLVFLGDCNLLDGLPKVDGFFSLNLRESDKVLRLLDSADARELPYLEDFLGVSQTIAPGTVFDWAPRATFLPIVSIGQAPVFASPEMTFAAIERGSLDFRKVVYLPTTAQSSITAKSAPAARIVAKDFHPQRETIQVETPAPAMFYLSQAYYHDWHATVDGKEVSLWRANYAFQSVEMPPGRHVLRLSYVDQAYRLGTLLAALAGLGCLWIYWMGRPDKPLFSEMPRA